jgi:hypothetical protein
MKYVILEKAKKIYVPPGKRKGYWRTDPRTGKYIPQTEVIYHEETSGEKILKVLKSLLGKVKTWKKEKGVLTNVQKKYIRRRLKELKPSAKQLKTQKQRQAVSRALKELRKELKEKTVVFKTKDGKRLNEKEIETLRRLNYNSNDVRKLSRVEVKTIFWNEIPKGDWIVKAYRGTGARPNPRRGKAEIKRVAKRKRRELAAERKENIRVFGDSLDEK